jgi:hypothetical protein
MTTTTPRALHVTSPLTIGPDVLEIQRHLDRLGYAVGPLDGAYGVATAAAVRAFQRDRHLQVDGVVGPQTRLALVAAMPGNGPSHPSGSIGLRALQEARRHVGTKESPAGSNRTPFGRWFGVDGVMWCNVFVSYCFAVGGDYTICSGFRGAGVYPKGCTYVPTTEAWLRATGLWVGRTTPRPGDIAIFNWDGGIPDHIGIVERSLGGGRFVSIEGNTSVGNESNGGAVMRRTRALTQVNGFGRVD